MAFRPLGIDSKMMQMIVIICHNLVYFSNNNNNNTNNNSDPGFQTDPIDRMVMFGVAIDQPFVAELLR